MLYVSCDGTGTPMRREALQMVRGKQEDGTARAHYSRYQANGWFIGSGVVEAGCKAVVGRRLKQSGMFWGETGA